MSFRDLRWLQTQVGRAGAALEKRFPGLNAGVSLTKALALFAAPSGPKARQVLTSPPIVAAGPH